MALRNVGILVVVIALFASACSSSDDSATGADSEQQTSPVAAIGLPDSEEDPDAPPVVAGAPLNPFDLQLGQCFNEGSWYDDERERRIELTASIDCEQPHQSEIFFEAEFPAPNGAPFPGEIKMTEWSTELCYGAFEQFVGLEYELSRYEIGFIQPTEATFEHEVGRHRRVACVLFDEGGEELVGTARATDS